LEWLPLETIAYDGCIAENRLRFDLAPGAMTMGWDLLALGLPAAGMPWLRGTYLQQLELPGVWLERARICADDQRLLDSPLGWAGHRVLGTFWLAAGEALPKGLGEALIERARDLIGESSLAATAGVTAPHAATVVLRVLAPRVEATMQLLMAVRAAWRGLAWGLEACPPRIWKT
jgi:urease accessory protein